MPRSPLHRHPGLGLDKREYGTHPLRGTKASLIYEAPANLRAVQIRRGPTNIENTVRYLGASTSMTRTAPDRAPLGLIKVEPMAQMS